MVENVTELPITLSLNVNLVNVILRSLGKHPFEEINELIALIKRQGEAQIEEWQRGKMAEKNAAGGEDGLLEEDD